MNFRERKELILIRSSEMKWKKIYGWSIIGILFLSILSSMESFTNEVKIEFWTDEQCKHFHKTFGHHWVKRMTSMDLHARGVKSGEEYMRKLIEEGCMSWSIRERSILRERIGEIEKWLQLNREIVRVKWGIDVEKMEKIPWRLMKMGRVYENGLPHTREEGQVISLSEDFVSGRGEMDQLKTLLHERVHIYQKVYGREVEEYLRGQGIERLGRDSLYYFPRRRLNPDLDEVVYFNSRRNIMYGSRYRSEKPQNLQDVSYPGNQQENEHPFEEMAYQIEDMFVRHFSQ